jgi:hypothetical protein
MHKAQRHINHVSLVLDGSGSMYDHKRKLIEVADEQIRYLAQRSEELQQETRVSVYVFDHRVRCLIFDMDVMRLPSIADLYDVNGRTALIDAVIKSQDDLATTSQIYGDHAFLTFVLTDGYENASSTSWLKLGKYLSGNDNFSVAFLVPDNTSKAAVQRYGASPDSIALWNAASAKGIVEAVSVIRTATDTFMQNRASGVRSFGGFSTGVDAVNARTVKANLKPLKPGDYSLHPVGSKAEIRPFVQALGFNYLSGMAYYQLTKTEKIQGNKQIIVVEKKTGKAYSGEHARDLIGLPRGVEQRVKPDYNPDYDIYVQSTSVNRHLLPNTKLLVSHTNQLVNA